MMIVATHATFVYLYAHAGSVMFSFVLSHANGAVNELQERHMCLLTQGRRPVKTPAGALRELVQF